MYSEGSLIKDDTYLLNTAWHMTNGLRQKSINLCDYNRKVANDEFPASYLTNTLHFI